ncbi:hypothetical protein [uncultured Duncaniella sp.]|uniref:hypothetical protein n=1 Tax=uncultured Duncaniella sp. TaxID=2768039 RepID=UPI0025B712FB|nr:hypothetical protein [uncultured Duncaniella sp.]
MNSDDTNIRKELGDVLLHVQQQPADNARCLIRPGAHLHQLPLQHDHRPAHRSLQQPPHGGMPVELLIAAVSKA